MASGSRYRSTARVTSYASVEARRLTRVGLSSRGLLSKGCRHPFSLTSFTGPPMSGPRIPKLCAQSWPGVSCCGPRIPTAGTPGLRVPQAGAAARGASAVVHRVERARDGVLPTGTGKTETMVSLFASERPERLLVVVPSDRLRTQIAEAFETYGVLPATGVLDASLPGPVVGRIEHHFSDLEAMRSFVERCNVLVTTPNALDASGERVRAALIARCSHLFVDEAHHVSALQLGAHSRRICR